MSNRTESERAGGSAEHSANRMREKAERLNRAAEKWQRGAEGERKTALALASLPAEDWTVFHDVRWPGRHRANIDHVVVGPSGVFVIDSKNWTGAITVQDGVLRQDRWRRDREAQAVVDAADAVHRIAPLVRREHLHAVMCFAGQEVVTGTSQGVTLCSTTNIAATLQAFPSVFAEGGQAEVVRHLRDWFAAMAPDPPNSRRAQQPHRPAPRAVGIPRMSPPPRRRTSAKQSCTSRLVGIAAGIVILAVAFTQEGLFHQFSAAFVGMATNHQEGPQNRWTCSYSPTMNHNWHDDVLCTKGTQTKRPRLLPTVRHVTQDDIERAAAQYESRLNR